MFVARLSTQRCGTLRPAIQKAFSFSSFSASLRISRVNSSRYFCSLMDDEDVLQVRLAVLGVGGAGCNAVNTMINKKDLTELEFFVANTDAQSLLTSSCPKEDQIQIGHELTKGLGAGANPSVGKEAAEENLDEIISRVGNANMCFITAGMGGGTGTGAAPVIGKALREKGILTIGMVCMPFRFEGKRKQSLAIAGIEEMRQSVDTLIVVQNQRLLKTLMETQDKSKRLRDHFHNSFKMVDDIFYEGIKAVTDVIVKPGLINLDFADVKTITEGPGWGIMGSGYAEGHGKAEVATLNALDNPLLSDTSKTNATGVLVSITGGPDLAILEVDEILRLIRQKVSAEANIIFGATSDENMKGAIRVSLILTGPYEDDILNETDEFEAPPQPENPGNAPLQQPPFSQQFSHPTPAGVSQTVPPQPTKPVYPSYAQQYPQAPPGQQQPSVQQRKDAPRPSQVFHAEPATPEEPHYIGSGNTDTPKKQSWGRKWWNTWK